MNSNKSFNNPNYNKDLILFILKDNKEYKLNQTKSGVEKHFDLKNFKTQINQHFNTKK